MSPRLVGLAYVVLAAAAAPTVLTITAFAKPDPGVVTGEPGGRVEWVLPGGPSWRDGIRAGQTVVELAAGVDPTHWVLRTSDGVFEFATSFERHLAALRDTTPYAVVALVLGALSLALYRRVIYAAAAASVALVVTGAAIERSGYEILTVATSLLGLAAPVAWLAIWQRQRLRSLARLVAAAAAITAVVWLVGRFLEPDLFDSADLARQVIGGSSLLAVILSVNDGQVWRRRLVRLDGRRTTDIIALAVLLGLGAFLAVVVQVPLPVLAILLASTVVVYPRFRRAAAGAIDQMVLGDIRARASIQAVEDERGRIARDLHDEPLQEIAAVIRRLDSRPEVHAETQLLRDVADHLRRVTTELRPPVLDDLGLTAAVAFAAERARTAAPEIEVVLDVDADDAMAARAPTEVELAIYRIAQEAIDNALLHSGARSVRVAAKIGPTRVQVSVEDDGIGLSDDAARDAARAGHLGLVSMAQRATAIGAHLVIEKGRPLGTRVMVIWPDEA